MSDRPYFDDSRCRSHVDIFPYRANIAFNTRAVPLPVSGDVHHGRVSILHIRPLAVRPLIGFEWFRCLWGYLLSLFVLPGRRATVPVDSMTSISYQVGLA